MGVGAKLSEEMQGQAKRKRIKMMTKMMRKKKKKKRKKKEKKKKRRKSANQLHWLPPHYY